LSCDDGSGNANDSACPQADPCTNTNIGYFCLAPSQ
jgi:hypothetical protein